MIWWCNQAFGYISKCQSLFGDIFLLLRGYCSSSLPNDPWEITFLAMFCKDVYNCMESQSDINKLNWYIYIPFLFGIRRDLSTLQYLAFRKYTVCSRFGLANFENLHTICVLLFLIISQFKYTIFQNNIRKALLYHHCFWLYVHNIVLLWT